jgi:hypothetical protein
MKSILQYIAAGVTPYLFFAFTFWDANPENWNDGARAFCAIVSFVLIGLNFAIKNDIQ